MYQHKIETAQQSLLESLPVAILIVDKSGIIHYSNHESHRLFGSKLTSTNVTDWSDDLNEHAFLNVISTLNDKSQAVKFNIALKHNKHTHSFEVKVIINPEDKITGPNEFYLMTFHLINDSLNGIKSASHHGSSSFKKNFKELKQFSRLSAMREISSSLADKLNQPLTAILSYTQAMQRLYQNNAPSEEINDAMERVVVNAQNAGKIIKKIRAQLNVNTLHSENICLNHLIQEAIHLTELNSLESPIHFVTQLEPSFMSFCVDRVQMRQVIFSLLNNAIDAVMDNSSQSPEITLTTRLKSSNSFTQKSAPNENPDDLCYEIEISDNGAGFPEEIQDKIFEPFTTTKENGIGIGLSMCHHIIDLHHGSITIASPATKAATVVTICLPLISNQCAKNNLIEPHSK